MMKLRILSLFLIFFFSEASASLKDKIIQKLDNTNNLTFNFEQNVNGKVENGNCSIEYPKKIFCEYNLDNKKILVSNGKSLVIKTSTSFYIYPIDRTPLNFILDKKFLKKKINSSEERLVNDKFVNFAFNQNDNLINIFFDTNTYNLIGWQTLDIYQNLSITYLFSIQKNQDLDQSLFKIPKQN